MHLEQSVASSFSFRLKPERRVHRLLIPACDDCGNTKGVSAVGRTANAVSFHCPACGRVRKVPVGDGPTVHSVDLRANGSDA